ncbi:hypothetical protein [Streptomyces sp. NBC_00343]|uniref:hypothetical protein n=1 Tax=Streptomyces sp. NBC_00343 TaxID=2975719 RepID=UPI002E2B5012|nr:hypothetical protein [Streptomyces sp. NBC_00343]
MSNVLPGGTVVMFNAEWGVGGDLPPLPVFDAIRPRILAAFVARLEGDGGLD